MSVRDTISSLPSLESWVSFDSGEWRWSLNLPSGTALAVSGRGFRHERDCRYNLSQFLRVAPPTLIPAQRVTEIDLRDSEREGSGAS